MSIAMLSSLTGVGFAQPVSQPDWRELLRQHLRDPRFALDRRPEYVVTDPAVVEPALDAALRGLDPGRPGDETLRGELQARAAAAFRHEMGQPAGLRALEQLIRLRFERPIVDVSRHPEVAGGEVVTMDHGLMPGELVMNGASIEMRAIGEHFDRFLPSTPFMARLLDQAVKAHPRAAAVRVLFKLLRHRREGEFVLSYWRTGSLAIPAGWVGLRTKGVVGSLGAYQVAAPGSDFTAYLAGRYSFYEDCAALRDTPRSSASAERQRDIARRCLVPMPPTPMR